MVNSGYACITIKKRNGSFLSKCSEYKLNMIGTENHALIEHLKTFPVVFIFDV